MLRSIHFPRALSLLLSALLVALLLSGCRAEEDTTQRLTAEDDGATVQLAPGDEVVVELESNVTTGYEWKLTALDTSIVRETSRDYTTDEENKDSEGGGGTTELHYEAVGAGNTTLQLAYTGPSSPTNVTDRYSITFVVRAAD